VRKTKPIFNHDRSDPKVQFTFSTVQALFLVVLHFVLINRVLDLSVIFHAQAVIEPDYLIT
jgi:hypothetical protein